MHNSDMILLSVGAYGGGGSSILLNENCNCSRLKCFLNTTSDEREYVYNKCQAMEKNSKIGYLWPLVEVFPVRGNIMQINRGENSNNNFYNYKYYMEVNRNGQVERVNICRKAFLGSHGLSSGQAQKIKQVANGTRYKTPPFKLIGLSNHALRTPLKRNVYKKKPKHTQCYCIRKCCERLTSEEIIQIRTLFENLNKTAYQNNFLKGYITAHPVKKHKVLNPKNPRPNKYSYIYTIPRENTTAMIVCAEAFKIIFGIPSHRLQVVKTSLTGYNEGTIEALREKQRRKIKRHMFPFIKHQTCHFRVDISVIYEKYCIKYPSDLVSFEEYLQIFKEDFPSAHEKVSIDPTLHGKTLIAEKIKKIKLQLDPIKLKEDSKPSPIGHYQYLAFGSNDDNTIPYGGPLELELHDPLALNYHEPESTLIHPISKHLQNEPTLNQIYNYPLHESSFLDQYTMANCV